MNARSALTYGTNFIANSATNWSAERIAGPATFHKLPNFIGQLGSFITVWSFWSEMLVHNKIAKFARTDMTKGNLVGIDLVKSLSPIMYILYYARVKITSYDVIPNA